MSLARAIADTRYPQPPKSGDPRTPRRARNHRRRTPEQRPETPAGDPATRAARPAAAPRPTRRRRRQPTRLRHRGCKRRGRDEQFIPRVERTAGGDHQQHLALRWSLGARAQGTASWCAPIVRQRELVRGRQPGRNSRSRRWVRGSQRCRSPRHLDVRAEKLRVFGPDSHELDESDACGRRQRGWRVLSRPVRVRRRPRTTISGAKIAPDIGCDLGVRVPDRVTIQSVRTLAALVGPRASHCDVRRL